MCAKQRHGGKGPISPRRERSEPPGQERQKREAFSKQGKTREARLDFGTLDAPDV
jgi:hypothetical protein